MAHLSYRRLLVALAAAVPLLGSASGAAKNAPNILVILADDQDLQMNSMAYMPKLKDELAGQGTTFQHHYCTSALCCPSRVSLWTGKCVHNTNVTNIVLPFGGYPKFISEGLDNDYLPLWLDAGGVNSYYIGKFANGHSIRNYRETPLKGWTSGHFLLEPGTYDYLNSTWALDQEDWTNYLGQHVLDRTTTHSLAMIDKAVAAGKPWFMAVAPAVPHNGINASDGSTFFPIPQDKYKDAFPGAKVPRTPNWNPPEVKSGVGWLLNLPLQNETTVNTLDLIYRKRLQAIAGMDDLVDSLISALEKHGVLDNTHIVYTSDNGYHLGQYRLGPGKKQGFETDISVPFVWRGPGVKKNYVSNAVSTHTDLAATFLSLFGLPLGPSLDGRTIPEITGDSQPAGEHVNIELWGGGEPYELDHLRHLQVEGVSDNTYKGLRIIADSYSLYYSVWCTNEHELYDMVNDPYQTTNILANTQSLKTLSQAQTAQTYLDRPLQDVLNRLDALMLVLKSCVGSNCTAPWNVLHPNGKVSTLKDALDSKFDTFYSNQPKVEFSECQQGYFKEAEGVMDAVSFSDESAAAALMMPLSVANLKLLSAVVILWLVFLC